MIILLKPDFFPSLKSKLAVCRILASLVQLPGPDRFGQNLTLSLSFLRLGRSEHHTVENDVLLKYPLFSFHPPLHVLQRCSRHPESASFLQHRRGLLRADADVLRVQRLPGQPVHDAGAEDERQHPGAGADRQPDGRRARHGHRHRVRPLLPGGQPALNCDIN